MMKQTELDPFMFKFLVEERDLAELSGNLKKGYDYALYMIGAYYQNLGTTFDERLNEKFEELLKNV